MFWRSLFKGRSLRAAFLISLTLNFFLLAFGASLYSSDSRPLPPSAEELAERMADSLSDDGKALFLDTFEKYRSEIAKRHFAVRQAQERIHGILSSEEVDVAKLRDEGNDMRQRLIAFMTAYTGFVMEAAVRLPIEDRRKLLQTFPK